MVAPRLLGDLATASNQAALFVTGMTKPVSLRQGVLDDMHQLVTHAQAWLVLMQPDGTMRPVPAKLAGYDCPLEDYPPHRLHMSGTRAAQLIGKWATPAPASDPAFQAIKDFCSQHGLLARKNFRVLVGKDIALAPAKMPVQGNDQVVADLILAILPQLNAEQRARVADAARWL